MISRTLFTALVVLCVPLAAFCQTERSSESYVGKAGDVFISEEEFLHRFESLPAFGRHRKSQLDYAKLELLYSIIAEKLLAQEAVSRRMDQDAGVQTAVLETRKLLARDELYREEIIGKVTVADKEIRQAVTQAQRQLLVSYLFFEKEEEASFIRSRLKGPKDFDLLQIDSSMHAVRDTVTVVWGEADPSIEDAAYRLRKGEVSPVIATGSGFYVLKLSSEQRSKLFSSLEADALVDRVKKTIRLRKERARLDEYAAEILRDKTGYSRPREFKTLVAALAEVYTPTAKDSATTLTPEMVAAVRERCSDVLRDTLVVIDTAFWSMDDVIKMLFSKGVRMRFGNPAVIARTVNSQIRIWVQQELMAREALRRRMDAVPAVQRRVEMWKQYFLAEQLKGILTNGVTVTEAEAWSFMKALDPALSVPQVQIRELKTRSLEEMKEALEELEKGVSFEAVVRRWSNDRARERGGTSEFFAITDRPPVGEIASQMDVGQRYGPLSVSDGYLCFEVLAKKSAPVSADTSTAVRLKEAREQLLKLKKKRKVSLFLSQAGQERGFSVYEDRLRALNVTTVPMMTFRILGFGGRMIEVPFVEKQIEWLGIEPPKTKILP